MKAATTFRQFKQHHGDLRSASGRGSAWSRWRKTLSVLKRAESVLKRAERRCDRCNLKRALKSETNVLNQDSP